MDDLLQQCNELSERLHRLTEHSKISFQLNRNPQFKHYFHKISEGLHAWMEVYRPTDTSSQPIPSRPLKAIAYNIERGKHLGALIHVLKSAPDLNDADVYFLTEVDWGMARTNNLNVAAEIGKALGFHAYFAPSYFNLTKGHGTERQLPGKNALGLHGKALLSRYPLKNLRVARMPNAIDKIRSKESRLGEKRALLGELECGEKHLAFACIHLDAYSSANDRAKQMDSAIAAIQNHSHVLLAGDWNTNTINSCSSRTLLASLLKQLTFTGPRRMIQRHFPFPECKFDRPLFRVLEKHGFQFENYNEIGIGTFDLLANDQELGKMANDQYPLWLLNLVNRLVKKSGGLVTLKLDWFAGKGLHPLRQQVIRLKPHVDFDPNERPSDHHPIALEFAW